MSSCSETQLQCPQCGHEGTFTLWNSVNVELDPSLKQKLMDGELTTYTCGECGSKRQVVHNLLYNDMGKSRAIWLMYPDEPDKAVEDPPSFQDLLPKMKKLKTKYTNRLVTSLPHLLEKIRVFDDEFDDVFIELVKLGLETQVALKPKQMLLYHECKQDEGDQKALTIVLTGDGPPQSTDFPLDVALDATKEIMNSIDWIAAMSERKWPIVDRKFVQDQLEQHGLSFL